ncbi:putative non-specific serine/threonine protein kinase [Helianthus annuus]|nr:putative non-specific serine/threonine protein kinase [Helianthus annuus]
MDLAYNQLTGNIPDSVGNLSLLKTLQMNIKQLTGSIPDTIGRLSSLNFLDLSYNQLNGSLPKSIGRLRLLQFLTVHHNSFTGIVTENHLTNLTSLKTLWIGDNKLVFTLNVKNWIPPFQLEVLRIGSCSFGSSFSFMDSFANKLNRTGFSQHKHFRQHPQLVLEHIL